MNSTASNEELAAGISALAKTLGSFVLGDAGVNFLLEAATRLRAAEARAAPTKEEAPWKYDVPPHLRAAEAEVARLRGEAEGKLHVSELAGVVDGWQRRAEAAEIEVARCHARLEIEHYWAPGDGDDQDLVRVDIPMEERRSLPDAVDARDATIAELEALIARKDEALTPSADTQAAYETGAMQPLLPPPGGRP